MPSRASAGGNSSSGPFAKAASKKPSKPRRNPEDPLTQEELDKLKEKQKRAAELRAAEEWINSLWPRVDVVPIEQDDEGMKVLSLVIWTPPQVQVRQTTNSSRYKIPAIRYNGWKRRISEAVKNGIRKSWPDMPYFTKQMGLRFTLRVHVHDSFKVVNADLDNFVKAAKDMLNHCTRQWEENSWPDITPPRPVWQDDKQVWEYGIPMGKFWAPEEQNARMEIEIERIAITMPTKKTIKTVTKHKQEIWEEIFQNTRHREDAIRESLTAGDPEQLDRFNDAMVSVYAELDRKRGASHDNI